MRTTTLGHELRALNEKEMTLGRDLRVLNGIEMSLGHQREKRLWVVSLGL